ncbi:hypothetical protein Hypma_000332 [Hypsizygus marmoreus]|uniref:WSC domain-containing protein n=1 Tax=Hypsizygus marmoreus TaxID=39966 RepID=A0A369JI36_HYPMA|nr:hypothetical protein Hypma_000332 [Hypsizygus marmoreus]
MQNPCQQPKSEVRSGSSHEKQVALTYIFQSREGSMLNKKMFVGRLLSSYTATHHASDLRLSDIVELAHKFCVCSVLREVLRRWSRSYTPNNRVLCGLELPISLLKTHHSGGLTTLSFPPILQIPIESITVETCIGACKAGGYYIARLRYGQECWCDAKT